MYTRLNHLNVTLSYSAVLKSVGEISTRHGTPLQKWINDSSVFKFVGDNVDKKKGVRDIRSDHHGELKHMFSLLAIKGSVKPPPTVQNFVPISLSALPVSHFLPTKSDVAAVKKNLIILISRVLCEHIKPLKCIKQVLVHHIPHIDSSDMAKKSDTIVLDVLHKNEAKHADMIDIMVEQQSYLGPDFSGSVLSGGDLMTCERQTGSKQHMMDADTLQDRLELLEPIVEDWHCLQSVLGLGNKINVCTKHIHVQ